MTLTDLKDPRTLYPQPPFEKQPQPAPGFTEKMDPRPDHGEDSYIGHGRLAGRKALITGGDSGIGRAAAIAMVREGAVVTLNYLPDEEEDARSLQSLLAKDGEVHLIPGDITDKAFCRALIKDAAGQMGGLDILVNNAAKQVRQESIDDISDEQFDGTMKTNVYALFWLTTAAMKIMPPGSTIINVSSTQGFNPAPVLIDYATSKFAIRGFTEALAQGAIEKGIRVNGIAPGPFWTPLQPSTGQSQDKVQHFGEATPMGRPGQPAELGGAFVFLASQESSYMTGEFIGVTGGKPIS
ncbi:SDR family oxidoreductase [Parvularcula sp. LCG005]|uniref:SDR family oxidoreductase n=1 Tax=Parvularcula sp. LCG005 TaxID=3078805 RepID=UPI002941D6DE|nr:SDR family oxidoreductase [Parvularcula sp. LCG005]WOI53016.1 SDR family oxidoreductase [Parvularcula sp. LCG005]